MPPHMLFIFICLATFEHFGHLEASGWQSDLPMTIFEDMTLVKLFSLDPITKGK